MLDVSDISLHFGGRLMFQSASFRIEDMERAAIVGPNGSGKSTMLKIVSGAIMPETGTVSFPKNTEVGYLPQEMEMHSSRTVGDECREVFRDVIAHEIEMRDLEHRMADLADHTLPEFRKVAERYEFLAHELQRRDYHTMEAQIGRILAGLGFKTGDVDRPCATFSGGWQMRIALSRLLLQNPDILLLDEPTNHLDIESIEWLADWISGHHGSVLMVSHERSFMDRLSAKTIALEGNGRLVVYRGNYSQSLAARAERREMQRRAYENQQQEIAQTQRFIDRFRYQASKAALVQSRVKALERMERVDPPPPDDTATIHIRFPQPGRTAKEVAQGQGVTKAYADNVVLGRVDFSIYRGEKVALVGVNGAGKTTLMRILADRLTRDEGQVALGGNVEIEYFAQYDFDDLNPERTVLDNFLAAAPVGISGEARSILGAFLFSNDDVDKPVRVLSGGEKTRLRLAKILCGHANFLLLDEPTNHLDIASRITLERALREYEGTVLFVSHDRYFLDSVPTRILEIADGCLRSFPGNYEDYLQMRELGGQPPPPITVGQADPALVAAASGKKLSASGSGGNGRDGGGTDAKAPRGRAAEDARLQALADELAATPRRLGKDQRKRLQKDRQEWSRRMGKAERRVREAETEIARLEKRIAEVETDMNRPGNVSNSGKLMELAKSLESLRAELAAVYEEWEKAQAWQESLAVEEPQL